MNRTVTIIFALSVGVAIGVTGGSRLVNLSAVAQTAAMTSFSAVPDAIGEQDISRPYQVQAGWPKDLSTLPGHEKWTYGGGRGSFSRSPHPACLLCAGGR